MIPTASKTPGPYLSARAATRGKRVPLTAADNPPFIIETSVSDERNLSTNPYSNQSSSNNQNTTTIRTLDRPTHQISRLTPSEHYTVDNNMDIDNDNMTITPYMKKVLNDQRRKYLGNITSSDDTKGNVRASMVAADSQRSDNQRMGVSTPSFVAADSKKSEIQQMSASTHSYAVANNQKNDNQQMDTIESPLAVATSQNVVPGKNQPQTYTYDDSPPDLNPSAQDWAWLDTEVIIDPDNPGKMIVAQKSPETGRYDKPMEFGESHSFSMVPSPSEHAEEVTFKLVSLPEASEPQSTHSEPPAPNIQDVQETPGRGTSGIAQYDFTANQSNELSFKKGDRLTSIKEVDANWFVGEDRKGRSGLFPKKGILSIEKTVNKHGVVEQPLALRDSVLATSSASNSKKQTLAVQPNFQQSGLPKETLTDLAVLTAPVPFPADKSKPETAVDPGKSDSSLDPSLIRSVFVKNLPETATLTLVCILVTGYGKIASMDLDLSNAKARVTFVNPAAARQLVTSNLEGIKFTFRGTPYVVTFSLDSASEPIGIVLQAQLDCGATRCVRAIRVNSEMDVRVITRAAEHHGGGDAEYIGYEAMGKGGCVVIWRWGSIEQAVKFKKGLEMDGKFGRSTVFFSPDPCEGRSRRRGMGRIEKSE